MQTLKLTDKKSFEVLLASGWTEFDAVRNLKELAALPADDGTQVLVLDQSELYTLDTSSSATADGLRVIVRMGGAPGRWLLFVPGFYSHLWVCQAGIDRNLYAFTDSQATTAPTSAPAITLTLPDTGPADGHVHNVTSFGFLPNGDAWVGFADRHPTAPNHGQYVAKLSASKLSATAAVTPDWSFPVFATGISSLGINAILFDPAGNMWIGTLASTGQPAGILMYAAADLAAPGSPSPTVVLHQAAAVNSVNDLWFDGSGNLWFANAVARSVNRLSASQLLSSNPAVVPDIVLQFSAPLYYAGVTLDSAGNLWCARAAGAGEFVDVFAPADVAASGTPTPIRSIGLPGIGTSGASAKPRFDRTSDLWVNTSNGPAGYPPESLLVSGTPIPNAILTGGGVMTAPRVLNFSP